MQKVYKFIKLLRSNFVLLNLPVIIALFMLGTCPFLLLLDQEGIANQNAGFASYFLIAGVMWKIILYLMHKNLQENGNSTKKLAS